MFKDRADAGRHLAEKLQHLCGDDTVVVGLPRGGVPVAYEVAGRLEAPLDVILVRKLGLPYQPELAMGAIGEDGVRVTRNDVIQMVDVADDELARVEQQERQELDRRARRYRAGRDRIRLRGCQVIIVDDGLATGSTAEAACQVARREGARRIVLAVPVAPPGWAARMGRVADELVAVATPEPFFAIGQFYQDFSPTSDEEVVAYLEEALAPPSPDENRGNIDGAAFGACVDRVVGLYRERRRAANLLEPNCSADH